MAIWPTEKWPPDHSTTVRLAPSDLAVYDYAPSVFARRVSRRDCSGSRKPDELRKAGARLATSYNIRLLVSCPDKKGLIAAISQFIAMHDGNILSADQYVSEGSGKFFMRLEIEG